MKEYYCKVNETPKRVTVDCGALLDDCYFMICNAREKLPRYRDIQIHIVLPADYLRALRYYLAGKPDTQMFVTGSLNPFENRLFGAILHDSQIAESPLVY